MNIIFTLLLTIFSLSVFGQEEQKLSSFLPKGYVIFEKKMGDLNNDGRNDCVLIIKGTDTNQIITDEYERRLDINRRGIIVLFSKNGHFELASKNYACFSSEKEAGNYFATELYFEVKNETLIIHFAYGRNVYCKYTFRFSNSDFELIGYDQGDRSSFVSDWVTFDETSVNLLTKKKVIKNVIKVAADGREKYREVWKNLSIKAHVRLSEIKNFDELAIDDIIKEK